MALPGSPIYSTTYVKISKKDINGDDVTSTLENLLYFTLKYTDIGSVQFIIEDKTEYTDYYLFKIKLTAYNQSNNINTLVSSSNNNILNYQISASNNTSQTGGILTYSVVNTDVLGYLTASNGYYTLHNTPNIPLIISASATLYSDNGTLGTEIRLYKKSTGGLQGVPGFSYTQVSLSPSSSATLYLSGSLTPIKGETYVVGISDDSPSDTDITASFATFKVTQSIAPNVGVSGSGDDLIIVTSGNEEENPLYGNADLIVLNPRYITLDYTAYTLPEEEFQLVLSGSGTNSTVKQYNYEANRIVIPRYKGSRSNSPDFNQNTTEGGLGVSPNVERTNVYFAAINNIQETDPEILGTSVANLKFLIDNQGNTYELNNDPSNISFFNSTFTFEKNKSVTISDSEGNNLTSSIFRSGYDVIPILHSDMGTYYQPTLSFSDTGVGNYLHNATFQGYGVGPSPYNWAPQVWGSSNYGGNVNINEANNHNKNFFFRYPTSASSFDPSLVEISNVVVPISNRTQENSGYQGNALSRFYTGSIYHITTNRPDTSLKFSYNFYLQGLFGFILYNQLNNFNSLPWKVTVSICRDNTSNLSFDGTNYTWDINNPSTQILTQHIYKGDFKRSLYTDIWTGGNYNSLTNTTTYTFDGYNGFNTFFTNIFNTWNNNYTDFWSKIETNFIPDLQIDDVIGINIKVEYPPTAGIGTAFTFQVTPTLDDYNNNRRFKTFNVFSNPLPSMLIVPEPAPFFTTASGNPYTLIAYQLSASSNPALTSGLAQAFGYKQQNISESGYKPLTKISQPLIGDEIRFNYDEATSYVITSIGSDSGGNVTLSIDKPIPDGLDLNWFLIRRYIKNPSKLIINTPTVQSTGFAFPEYMSKNIIDNLPKIIETLKTQNLI